MFLVCGNDKDEFLDSKVILLANGSAKACLVTCHVRRDRLVDVKSGRLPTTTTGNPPNSFVLQPDGEMEDTCSCDAKILGSCLAGARLKTVNMRPSGALQN